MERIWTLKTVPEEKLERLKNTGFPPIFLSILINRGIDTEEAIEKYFVPKSRFLFSPFMLDGVCKAVKRIFRAIKSEEGIRVYGDRDVDGITSTVLLVETLRTFSNKVDYTVPVIEDGYGLNPDYIDAAVKDGVTLIITVDCGISNIEEVEYARSKGIDVVITDHHEAPAELPKAYAIIDPKIHGSCCPQNNIAGVGVAFKTALALEMARSKSLTRPVYAFDFRNNQVDVVRFTPQEGFSEPMALDFDALYGKTLLFFNEEEQKVIGEMFPAVLKNTDVGEAGEPIFLEKVFTNCMPEIKNPSKSEIAKELNLEDFAPAKSLLLSYLKCLESKTPGVKALWKRSLDVLTIGTIADMVPLRGENRAFTQMGLKFVGKTSRIGLQNLFSLLGWQNKKVLERDISFSIAPILNSSGRLKTAELAIELLTTEHSPRAENLASELFALNDERKKLGEECYREVKDFLIAQNDLQNDKLLMVAAPIKNQGVTGIVATRLMLDYCRPVIVLLEDQGNFLGSARSFKEINIISALNYCSELLEKYGGHIGAAGLTISTGNIDAFRTKLREYASTNISDKDLQPEWRIDYKVEIDDIDDQFMNDLLKFSPFGIENPAPLFLAENVSFYEIRKVGETKAHLRFKVRKGGGRHIFGIGFNMGDIMVPDIIRDGTCDIVFHVEPNDYNGVRSAQLMVCDCKIRGFK